MFAPVEHDSTKDLIPLYIGISGHRDIRLEDQLILKNLIVSFIREKRCDYPNTPVILLTPLAEGADRIAAYAAREAGIPYLVPLPMPIEPYRHDFDTPDSLNEFNRLLEEADMWFELPLSEGTLERDLQTSKPKRDLQYALLGNYIANNSHILIALWDGVENAQQGGTSEVIRLKKSGQPERNPRIRHRLRTPQSGSIYHILTPRKNSLHTTATFTCTVLWPDPVDPLAGNPAETDLRVLAHVEGFNREILRHMTLFNQTSGSVSDALGGTGLNDKDERLQKISRLFSTSDLLAGFFQKRRFIALRILLILAVLAFFFFQVYVEIIHRSFILLLYPVTLGIGALWFLFAERMKFEQKHEDYRALSEAYRIQYYLMLGMIDENVVDFYLQKYKGELEWVIYALRASLLKIMAFGNRESVKTTEIADRLIRIRKHWVEGQKDYYRNRAAVYEVRHKGLKRLANLLFMTAITAAAALFLFNVIHEGGPEVVHSLLVLCTHLSLVVSATLLGYNEKMVFSEQAKNCQQMALLFSTANLKLNNALAIKDYTEASEIIRELASETLMENAGWLVLHRSRPMEMPKG
jgi:hypothetical protein